MTAKSITVSLDMAKKLKAAGFLWSSCFFIRVGSMLDEKGVPTVWTLKPVEKWDVENYDPDILPSPTAEEIRLPQPHDLAAFYDWRAGQHETLADYNAAMWIYLKANNLLPNA